MKALSQPTRVDGPIQHRDQAETNEDLWLLSGRQSDALTLANGDKFRLRTFVLDAVQALREARQPACRWWDWKCHRMAQKAERSSAYSISASGETQGEEGKPLNP